MALGPKDLKLNEAQEAEVKRLEDRIDHELSKVSLIGNKSFHKVEMQVLDDRVASELIALYKQAGWSKVEFDGRDEWRFTI